LRASKRSNKARQSKGIDYPSISFAFHRLQQRSLQTKLITHCGTVQS
jgi:hypothetical protein